MVVMWWRLCGVTASVIRKFLDNKKKGPYKAYFRQFRELPLLQRLNIEIQEHDEGLWIEIHLSDTVDDKEDLDETFDAGEEVKD